MAKSVRRRAPPPVSEPEPMSYLDVFRAEPIERIGMVKRGIGASAVKRLLSDLSVPQADGLAALNLRPSTVNRRVADDSTLPPDESERVIGMARLIGQLEVMVQESGEIDGFDAHAWMSRWLREPLPALGGTPPLAFMDTMEGQGLVSRALAQAQAGAYA